MQDLLKIMTCGSVDDGKSTLLGHLMYDAKVLFTDQEKELKEISKTISNTDIDYSLLLDGLESEREQGITIDVAYRFFSTKKRSFIVADTPGHEEYTRNMAVGASFADLAILLIDASKGLLNQTYRHFRICSLMGITHYVFAINKMDLIDYDKSAFDEIKNKIEELTKDSGITSSFIIPVSAKLGDNITQNSENTKWYTGTSLLDYLETVNINTDPESGFAMPVQRVNKIKSGSRGYQGSVEFGTISKGDTIRVFPSKESSVVKNIFVCDRKSECASAGEQITITLENEIDISRGCVITKDYTPDISTNFISRVLWLDDEDLKEGKSYFIKIATTKVPVTITKINSLYDVKTNTHISRDKASKNDIAECMITSSSQLVTDLFSNHKSLGRFILIDRVTNATSACGIITKNLDNDYIFPCDFDITRESRASLKNQTPITIWLTGIPASGKSETANLLEKVLFSKGKHTMILDGDNIRSGINKNLTFSKDDRSENIRVVAEIAKLMNDAGLIVIVSLVSPSKNDRLNAKNIIGDCFKEVYVSAPIEVCMERDKKGYYKKAAEGLIKNFTGIDDLYEESESPNLILDTQNNTPEQCVEMIINKFNL